MKIHKRMAHSMKRRLHYLTILTGLFCMTGITAIQAQDRIPREYTSPDEVVTFDRTTSFARALDVINQFAQENTGKIIIDRTNTEGSIGITIPPMHWREALNLILSTQYLQMVERRDFYEIVDARVRDGLVAGPGQPVAAISDTALTTDSKEVRINAIFFEGSRRALQEIGVDWSTLTENVPANIGSYVGNQGGGGGSGGGAGGGGGDGQLPATESFDGPFVSVNSKAAQSVSQNVFNSLINFGEVFGSGIRVQALFSAFEADNLGEILASPSIKVLEGEEGRIQVGQDFSIKQRDFAGNVIDQFFSVGTILEVTPRIIEKQDTTFIHLDIMAERSSAQPDPVSTIINKQNATTQALLLDGEATVIAGLYRTEASEVRRGIPILKDLPPWFFGLRYLFGYNSKDFQTRELVILIQASIEPGIPERYGKDHRGKFETLENERERMQREIERYRKEMEDQTVPPPREQESELDIEDEEDDGYEDFQDSLAAVRQGHERADTAGENQQQQIRREQPVNEEIPAEEIPLGDPAVEQDSTGNDVPNAISKREHNYAYYVVGGSFRSEANAQSFKRRLQAAGYAPEILVNVEDGFYMVAYRGFDSPDEAKRFLQQIQRNTNEEAWIYDNF